MTQPINTSLIGPTSYSELRKLAERVDQWVKSPDGKASLERTAQSIRQMLEEAEENRKLDHNLLLKPMTI